MLDFSDLNIKRVCIHTIHQKIKGQDHAIADGGDKLVDLDDEAREIITSRLSHYCGERGRAFELKIVTVGDTSFFTPASALRNLSDEDFVPASKRLAQLLATKQRSATPRTANLFILDAVSRDGLPVVICIKAEGTEALTQEELQDGATRLRQVKNLFMGRTEKFFKVGAIYQLPLSSDNIDKPAHEQWGALLYDHLFRNDTKPASYFYQDFMGLDASQNHKIQSKEAYLKIKEFIDKHYSHDLRAKSDLLDQVDAHLRNPNLTTIDAAEIMRDLIPPDKQDDFNEEVVNLYPSPVVKDIELIKRKLSETKLQFDSGVGVRGSSKEFLTLVDVVENEEDLRELQLGQGYTILKIKGNPERYLRYTDAK